MDASVRFASDKDFMHWSESYFKHPTPEHVPAALSFCAKEGLLNEVNFAQLNHADNYAVFQLSQIFRRHSEQAWEWAKACRNFEEKSLKGVIQALWLSQNDECIKALKKFAGSTLKVAEYALELLPKPILPGIGDPLSFHLLWSAYYATGDYRHIGLLIDAIPILNQQGSQNDNRVYFIMNSLVMSSRRDAALSAFIVQHCRAHQASADPTLWRVIQLLAPNPRQNYSVDQLFPAQPNLKAEVKAKAVTITNIVFGMRHNVAPTTLQQAQEYALDQYRQLTGNISGEALNQNLFRLAAIEGIEDQGISEIAGCYGYCIKKKPSAMGGTDMWCERIPHN